MGRRIGGAPCQAPAMRGRKRCRLHGGKSTGPRTKEGIHRIRCASWKDGSRSARLQSEAKVEAQRHEAALLAMLLRSADAAPCEGALPKNSQTAAGGMV